MPSGVPPPKYPQLEFPVAATNALAKLNGPLGDAVTESLEKSMRSTVDLINGAGVAGTRPPPNHRLPTQARLAVQHGQCPTEALDAQI